MKTRSTRRRVTALAMLCMAGCLLLADAQGQVVRPGVRATSNDQKVTLNVENADISQVLNAFSLQTGRSVVIGPEVTATVNMRLQEVPWKEALDVVLRPYGFGYQEVGETIIINSIERIRESEGVEPVASQVFKLRFLDAHDVVEIVENMLTTRGQVSVVSVRGQKGWQFESTGNRQSTRGGGGMSKRERDEEEEKQMRTKTLVVTDVPAVLTRVEGLLSEVDRMPEQILIEATFVEVDSDFLKDVGVEFGTGLTGAESTEMETLGVKQGSQLLGVGAKQVSGSVGPATFNGQSVGLAETSPFNAGLSLMFQRLNDAQFQFLLHLLQEDVSANVLSAPSILTLNNQEAGIVVGTKFPIISSDTSGESANISTTLEYYENIGIQLNVVPQICDDGYINMIVHPAVTDQIGTAAARTGAEGNIPLTEYPVLSTREAETQIMIQSGQRIVIGGLLEDRESKTVLKVPLLGDIPLLGRLFRRETDSLAKTDLLIILSATIVTSEDMETERGRMTRPEELHARAEEPRVPTQPQRIATPPPAYQSAPTPARRDLPEGYDRVPLTQNEWLEPTAEIPLLDTAVADPEMVVLSELPVRGSL